MTINEITENIFLLDFELNNSSLIPHYRAFINSLQLLSWSKTEHYLHDGSDKKGP
jgi:hypothetical protein